MQLSLIPTALFSLFWAPLKANVGSNWDQVPSVMRSQVEIWVSWLCRSSNGHGALGAVWI